MENDNLLAGLEGFFRGFEGGYVPFMQYKYKSDLEAALKQKHDKTQFQQDMALDKYKSDLDYARESKLEELKSANKREKSVAENYPKGTRRPSEFQDETLDPLPVSEAISFLGTRTRQKAENFKEQSGGKKLSAKEDEDIKILKSLHKGANDLFSLYDEAKGGSGAIGGFLKSVGGTLSRGEFNAKAKAYNDRKREYLLTANKAMTGSSRGTAVSINAGLSSIPELSESIETANLKKQSFKNLIKDRIEELSGQPFSEDSGISPSSPKMFSDPGKQKRYEEWKKLHGN